MPIYSTKHLSSQWSCVLNIHMYSLSKTHLHHENRVQFFTSEQQQKRNLCQSITMSPREGRVLYFGKWIMLVSSCASQASVSNHTCTRSTRQSRNCAVTKFHKISKIPEFRIARMRSSTLDKEGGIWGRHCSSGSRACGGASGLQKTIFQK